MEKGLSGAPSLAQGWAGSPESSSNPNQGSVLKEQTKSKTEWFELYCCSGRVFILLCTLKKKEKTKQSRSKCFPEAQKAIKALEDKDQTLLLFKCTSLGETCFLFRTMVLGHELPPEQLLVWVEAAT